MQPEATAKGGHLTVSQQKALVALLAGAGVDAAAAASGCNPATVWRWQRQRAFQEALQAGRREQYRDAVAVLATTARQAVEALRAVVSDPTANVFARIQAAGLILSQGRQALELDDLAARLARIEERLTAQRRQTDERTASD